MTSNDGATIITGASSGIGRAIAVHFSEIGYKNLALVARRQEALEKTKEECLKMGATDVLLLCKDVAKSGASQEIVDETVRHFGGIVNLICNAGVSKRNLVRNIREEDYDYILDINLKACMFQTKYALPHLEKTKGSILYVSSVAASRTAPFSSLYSASKIALNNFARHVALEEAPKGIRVNTLSPGLILTEIHNLVQNKPADDETTLNEVRERGKKFVPLQRAADPEEMAKLAAFIMSKDNSYMTGNDVLADGGVALGGPWKSPSS